MLTLVNQHRTAMGLTALQVSPTLTASAQWKSLHMAYYQYMDHDDPAPPVARAWSDRLAACGYPSASEGENIAYGYATAQDVMTGWLNSPGHRANIESPATGRSGSARRRERTASGTGRRTSAPSSTAAAHRRHDRQQRWHAQRRRRRDRPDGGADLGAAGLEHLDDCRVRLVDERLGDRHHVHARRRHARRLLITTGYIGVGNGAHTFTVTVSNTAGSNSASFSWSITQPQTQPQPQSAAKPTVTMTSAPRRL